MKKTALVLFRRRCACLSAALGFLAALAFGPPPARAAVTEAWVHRYNNVVRNADDGAVKVVRDGAGDIIVSGGTEGDILTIKYSGADGSVIWKHHYNSPTDGRDTAFALAVDASGNIIVTGGSGWIFDWGGFGDEEFYAAKYAAADGALLWEKRGPYGVPAAVAVDGNGDVVITGSSVGSANLHDYYTAKYAAADGALLWEKRHVNGSANALALDGSGNVVVTGWCDGTNSTADYYTAKYAAADGAMLWEKRYNGPANSYDYAWAVAADGNSNVVVTGSSAGRLDSSGWPSYDYYTTKYAAADGALLWEKRYNGPANSSDQAHAVAVDGSGNVVVTGYSGNSDGFSDFYTVKYAAADGAPLWEKRSTDGGQVAVDGNGNVVVTGSSYNAPNYNIDYYTAKYAAADGALLWEKRYNGAANGDDHASAVAVDGSGNAVVTGSSSNGYNDDYYTAKYAAADGGLLWEKRYDSPVNSVNSEDQAQAVAVDGSGNVVVTGSSAGGLDSSGHLIYDYYTAKYAAANGALLWQQRYNGPANDNDYAQAVAVDGSGNVVVTGNSWNGAWNDDPDYYTAMYAAADGALLWEKRGPGGGSEVAVDCSGNVVVTGWSSGTNFNYDYYTAKYAAVNGALLWEKRYNGPANTSDFATAVAVDGSGNVVVTGHSYTEPPQVVYVGDYYTAKYAAADGALLWERRYNGPANSDDIANAVAVDGSGNVVVTGSSAGRLDSNGHPIYDYYTAKYAATNGALLWERRYNGPSNNNDEARAVAVDVSGNVVVTGTTDYQAWEEDGDYYTAKYAAADGALLWERRYNAPGNSYDYARAVGVDGSGNVVVTGYSNNGTNSDYYTAKYAAADGALLWEKRYDGPASGNDRVASFHPLALGPNGMVAITGSSIGSSGTVDYATVVYRDTPPPVSFAAWAASFGLSGVAAAADADPDSDGLPNGVEYILGGNPIVLGTSRSPAATTGGGNTVLTFPRDDESETSDVTLIVETGTDLLTWPTVFNIGLDTAASSPGVSIVENGDAPDTITVTIAQGADKATFARLKVTIAP